MSEVRIAAEPRTEFGKGGARRTRRAGRVPAVLYGHGTEPRHISLPARELMHAFKTDAGMNVLLRLDLNGSNELALPKAVQRHPIRGHFEHVDLLLVRRGEKVSVEVPIMLTGEAPSDALVDQQLLTLPVQAEATHIPDAVSVPIDGLRIGDSVTAVQVSLPSGVTLEADPEHVVVHLLPAPSAAQIEAELAGAEAELGAGTAQGTEQDAAKTAVGDGVSDRPTGGGDIVPDSTQRGGGPTETNAAGTSARPTSGG